MLVKFQSDRDLKSKMLRAQRQHLSTHLKEEAISRSVSWQSSLEAARKENLEKKGKPSRRTTTTDTMKSRTCERADEEGSGNSSNENSTFCAGSEYFNGRD